jgi:hypothetical protein
MATAEIEQLIEQKMEAAKRIVLSLDEIFSADDLQTEWVPIPEWAPKGAPNSDAYGVFVRSLNGRERATWQQKSVIGNGKNATVNFQQTTVTLVVMAAVDGAGKRIFTEAQGQTLNQKNSAILERIADVAMRLSGIGEEEMNTVSGNSTASQDDDSLTS